MSSFITGHREKRFHSLPATTCSLCRAGQRIGTPPSNLVRRSRPTSAPSNTGGESDATPPALRYMPGTSPGPAEKPRHSSTFSFSFTTTTANVHELRLRVVRHYQYSQMWTFLWAKQFLRCRKEWGLPVDKIQTNSFKIMSFHWRGQLKKMQSESAKKEKNSSH